MVAIIVEVKAGIERPVSVCIWDNAELCGLIEVVEVAKWISRQWRIVIVEAKVANIKWWKLGVELLEVIASNGWRCVLGLDLALLFLLCANDGVFDVGITVQSVYVVEM